MQEIKKWVKLIGDKLIVAGLNYITSGGFKTVFQDTSLDEVKDMVKQYYECVEGSKTSVNVESMSIVNYDLTPRYEEENDPKIYEEQDLYMDLSKAFGTMIQEGSKNDQRSLKMLQGDIVQNVKIRSIDFKNGIGVVDFTKNEKKYSASLNFPVNEKTHDVIHQLTDMILKLKAEKYTVHERDARIAVDNFCKNITKIRRIKQLHLDVTDMENKVVNQTTHVLKAATRNNQEKQNMYLIQTVINPDTDDAEILQYQIKSELPLSMNEKKYCSMIGFCLSQYLQGKENDLFDEHNVSSYTNIDLNKLIETNLEIKEKEDALDEVSR